MWEYTLELVASLHEAWVLFSKFINEKFLHNSEITKEIVKMNTVYKSYSETLMEKGMERPILSRYKYVETENIFIGFIFLLENLLDPVYNDYTMIG